MDGQVDTPQHDEQLTEAELKLIQSARGELEGERVRVVFRGQTFISPVLLPLLAPLLFAFLVKPRTVIVTDQSVLTVQESIWMQARMVRVVSSYPLGSVPIRATRLGIKIGQDPKVFAMPGAFAAMRQAVELGSRRAG